MRPITRPPATGMSITNQPRWWPAGDTSATSQRWKKQRFVTSPIRRSSASATTAARSPIASAIALIVSTRGVVVKSPSSAAPRTSSPLPRTRAAVAERTEHGDQPRGDGAQLGSVRERQPAQEPRPRRRQGHDHLPTVARMRRTPYDATRFAPVDELDGAVVAKLQTVGQRPDRRGGAVRHAAHREQELVLLRLQTHVACRLLAEVQETAQLVAKTRQRTIVGQGKHHDVHP